MPSVRAPITTRRRHWSVTLVVAAVAAGGDVSSREADALAQSLLVDVHPRSGEDTTGVR